MKTKKCRHCKSEIDKKATVCPHCQKSQGLSCGGAIVALVLTFVIGGFFITSCNKSDLDQENVSQMNIASTADNSSSDNAISTEADSVSDSGYASYQEILDEYTIKLQEATPTLIEEYNSEAAANDAGVEGLAEISNQKVEALAVISNEGMEKMAAFYMSHGSGQYSDYEDWAKKLQEVYTEEAQKIFDNYLNSAK